MSKTDAAYMKAYRARKKAELAEANHLVDEGADLVVRAAGLARAERQRTADANVRIAELEAEVQHLKAELAKREGYAERIRAQPSLIYYSGDDPGFGYSRPAPKTKHRP